MKKTNKQETHVPYFVFLFRSEKCLNKNLVPKKKIKTNQLHISPFFYIFHILKLKLKIKISPMIINLNKFSFFF